MRIEETKYTTDIVHLVDLDGRYSWAMLCGANVFTAWNGAKSRITHSTNGSKIWPSDHRCRTCLRIVAQAGQKHFIVTDESVEEAKKELQILLGIDDDELKELSPHTKALAQWLLDNGCAEERRGYGHISAADLAEKLVDGGWIKNA